MISFKHVILFLCAGFTLTTLLQGQNEVPQINITSIQNDDNNKVLTINYDLTDPDDTDIEVLFKVSDDDGVYFTVPTTTATGDLGFPINPGAGKVITWDYSLLVLASTDLKVKLIADDRFQFDKQAIVDMVNIDTILHHLTWMAKTRNHANSQAALEETKDSLEFLFEKHGLAAERQDFSTNFGIGQNILGVKKADVNDQELIVVGAHFDSEPNTPGADDNATGVVGVLEMARVLAPFTISKTVHFVGYDFEEEGLLGSIFYYNALPMQDTVVGNITLEMIGYYDESPNSQSTPFGFDILFPDTYAEVQANQFKGDFILHAFLPNAPSFPDSFTNAAASYVPDLKVINLEMVDNVLLVPDLLRSDHAPFWLDGTQASLLTNSANFRNPNYHSPGDSVGTLDLDRMAKVIKVGIGTILDFGIIKHSSSDIENVQVITSTKPDLSANTPFRVYPNPASKLVWLASEAINWDGQEELTIVDQAGKTAAAIIVFSSKTHLGVDISNFSAGLYSVRIQKNGQIWTKTFMVQ